MQQFQYKLRTFLVVVPLLSVALSFNLRVYERGPVHLGVQTSCQGWPFAYRRFWTRPDATTSDWNLVNLILDWHVWVAFGSIVWGLSEHYGRRRHFARAVAYINGATLFLTSAIGVLLGVFLFAFGEQYALPFLICALLGVGIGIAVVLWSRRDTHRRLIDGANESRLEECIGDEQNDPRERPLASDLNGKSITAAP